MYPDLLGEKAFRSPLGTLGKRFGGEWQVDCVGLYAEILGIGNGVLLQYNITSVEYQYKVA